MHTAKVEVFQEDLEMEFRVNILEVRACISLRSTMCPRDGKYHPTKHFSLSLHYATVVLVNSGTQRLSKVLQGLLRLPSKVQWESPCLGSAR